MKTEVFFLNLDRVPDRAVFMAEQCAHGGITAPIRVSATDASASPDYTSPRYNPHRWGPYWSMTKTEVAVFESHRKTWETIVETGRPGVIFEDDILLSSSAGAVIESLGNEHGGYELVKLDAVGGRYRFGPTCTFGGQTLRQIVGVLPSAAAYLLSPSGAAQLLELSQSYCDHLDDFITRPWPGFRAFQLEPAVAVQGMFSDLSGRTDIPVSVIGSERTDFGKAATDDGRGPFSYRAMKEIKRTARKIARKRGGDKRLLASGGFIGEIPLASDLPQFKR
ncbi:Glycosyltransferase family 25 (LPS biosynthesis protein) [Falsiruegeria litorea R37]|uniref:Glycosyltransferase family 25 (LPS biosynthesis protein) n=1 Tax=Falsiruegeria litorea R37 TaxID=1200284 RepID=A0A1Y5SF72_9RHOB|nr:glycosyltransferase family 25 protein [Falsiruegeria litorea]SLN37740.1 Glycosyltransferase family 25 (LPS biosynthesis protein) [Falsiruegeria litorea R37]